MTKLDTFGSYVRTRLESWGREFALHLDCEYLGHQSKNVLQVLIDHRGEMPGRTVGFKPLEVDLQAHQIELLVTDIARDRPDMAACLRAYYCGAGRRKVERWETARALCARSHGKAPTLRQYLGMVEDGGLVIRGALLAMSRAA